MFRSAAAAPTWLRSSTGTAARSSPGSSSTHSMQASVQGPFAGRSTSTAIPRSSTQTKAASSQAPSGSASSRTGQFASQWMPRPGHRQLLHRAPLAHGQIRLDLPEGLRLVDRRPRPARHVLPVLQRPEAAPLPCRRHACRSLQRSHLPRPRCLIPRSNSIKGGEGLRTSPRTPPSIFIPILADPLSNRRGPSHISHSLEKLILF